MHALRFCLLILIFLTATSWAASPNLKDLKWEPVSESTPEKLATRFGELTLHSSTDSHAKNEVLLAGKKLYTADSETYTSIYKVFQRSDSDVVLIGNNCGGSGCVVDALILAILKKDAKPQLIENPFLESYRNEIKFHQTGDTLSLSLGYLAAKLRVAVLNADNTVTTHLVTLPAQALRESDCKWLYDDVLDVCIQTRDEDKTCANPRAAFTGVYMRGMNAILDYPGYNDKNFTDQCSKACQTGKIPAYANFAVAVCSKPNAAATSKTVEPSSPTHTNTLKNSALTKDCEALLSQGDAAWPCLQANLLLERKRLNKAYKTLFDSLQPAAQTELEAKQKAWLTERDTACGKLLAETAATESVQRAPCVYQAIVSRANVLEALAKTVATTPASTTKLAKELWYKAMAKPFLIVRDQPSVTANKLGTIPEGGKVKVLEPNLKTDFISGRQGAWVKIEWLDNTGYVFDGFLEKL